MAEAPRQRLDRLQQKRSGTEAQVQTYFNTRNSERIQRHWTGTGSPVLRRSISEAVSLVLAAEEPRDLPMLVRSELDRLSRSSHFNAKQIFDDSIHLDRFALQRYEQTPEHEYSDTERTLNNNRIDRGEEITVGKFLRAQLEELTETTLEDRDKNRVAVLLAQFGLAVSGQALGRHENLKARMHIYDDLTSEAVGRLIPKSSATVPLVLDDIDRVLRDNEAIQQQRQ